MELMHAFQKYGGLVCNYAYSYLNNREEAEDVVQEVFLQLLETEKVFPFNDIAIKSYLLKSVRNSCLNILKKKKHFLFTADLTNYQVIDEEFASVDEDLIHNLQKEIFILAPQTQKIIVGIFYRKLTYKEIADELNISINTVKSLLESVIKKLRKNLNHNMKIILLFWYKKM